MSDTTEVATLEHAPPVEVGFSSAGGFELIQRMAKLLAASELVPPQFKGNVANTVIALEMAKRLNASPLAVMQNLYIVQGKPSWSAQFVIAAVNSTGRFSPLRFTLSGKEGSDEWQCIAWATEIATGEKLESPPVSIAMAKKEGWYGKNGSKWQTMPALMLRYRSATFFGRLYAPEILMGMSTEDEAIDITPVAPPPLVSEVPPAPALVTGDNGDVVTTVAAPVQPAAPASTSAPAPEAPRRRPGRPPRQQAQPPAPPPPQRQQELPPAAAPAPPPPLAMPAGAADDSEFF